MKRGDFVTIERAGAKIRGMVTLAIGTDGMVVVMFDGTLGCFNNSMPLMRDASGNYRDVIEGKLVKMTVLI
jgi:hypothetical protein